MNMTEWRKIPGYPNYAVSDDGQVRRDEGGAGARKGHIVQPYLSRGYFTVKLGKNDRWHGVHQLVLLAFVGECPPGCEVAHNNGIRTDNRPSNLRWATHLENVADRARHGTTARGSRIAAAKLTEDDVRSIRRQVAEGGLTKTDAARRWGVSRRNIQLICHGKSWKHV